MAQPAWIDLALTEIGQRELGGAADNPRIFSFYRDVGHPEAAHDEVAWCAAFVGAALERSGIGCTRSLLARSYLSWGEAMAMAKFGAVAVFPRGSDALGRTRRVPSRCRHRQHLRSRWQPGRCSQHYRDRTQPATGLSLADDDRWACCSSKARNGLADLRTRPSPRPRDGRRMD
jgi:uncharacterized protein (TIGR02594 family)